VYILYNTPIARKRTFFHNSLTSTGSYTAE
jgi:hypothetical protein